MVTSQVTIYRMITSYTIPSKSMDQALFRTISHCTLPLYLSSLFSLFHRFQNSTFFISSVSSFFFLNIYYNSNTCKLIFFSFLKTFLIHLNFPSFFNMISQNLLVPTRSIFFIEMPSTKKKKKNE